MEKPFSAKALYSEIESLYRSRVLSYLPLANSFLSNFGLEVGSAQLNDRYSLFDEFVLSPRDVDPNRETLESQNPSKELLDSMWGRYDVSSFGSLEDREGNRESSNTPGLQVLLDPDSFLFDFRHQENHSFLPIAFIRPFGSGLSFSDVVFLKNLSYGEISRSSYYDYGIEGWEGGAWDNVGLLVSIPKDKENLSKGELSIVDFSQYDFDFYRTVSKAALLLITIPLIEILFEYDISKEFKETTFFPAIGKTLSSREVYIEACSLLTLPREYVLGLSDTSDFFVSQKKVEDLVEALQSYRDRVYHHIVNPKAKEVFKAEMGYLLQEARDLLFRYWEKKIEERRVNGVSFISRGEVEVEKIDQLPLVLEEVFGAIKDSYQYLSNKELGLGNGSSAYVSFYLPGEPKNWMSSLPERPRKELPFSYLLSPLWDVDVEESTVLLKKSRSRSTASGASGLVDQSHLYLTPIGPLFGEGGQSLLGDRRVAYDAVQFRILDEESESNVVSRALSESLDPVFSLHSYLLPLVPSLFYYGYLSHLLSDRSNGGNVKVNIIPFLPKEEEALSLVQEVDESYFQDFSERVIGLVEKSFKEVWEGTLEEEHLDYIRKAKSFLDSLSPSEDRVFCKITSERYRKEGLYVFFNLFVKLRNDEKFLFSLRDLLSSSVSLLSKLGDRLEIRITFY